jgi:hypothetical protein
MLSLSIVNLEAVVRSVEVGQVTSRVFDLLLRGPGQSPAIVFG